MSSARVWQIPCLALISQSVWAGNYLVRWPETLLPENDDLRIYELTITLKCGFFKAVNNVPDDWNLDIIRPISGISELHAEAGHGVSYISSMVEFNEVIKVSFQPEDADCFELSANIARTEPDIGIEVRHADFTLIPVL